MKNDEKYTVTGWTYWEDDNYEEIGNDVLKGLINQDEIYDAVAKDLKKNNYIFCGETHQHNPHGVPVINDKYKVNCSMREWGGIIARAYNPDWENDYMAYVDWAWAPRVKDLIDDKPVFEEERIPE